MSEEVIKLPEKKVKIANRNPRTFVLYSQPKMGKTTVLSELEDCLLVDLEEGSDFVEALKLKASNLEQLYKIGEEIKKKDRPYKYVAIDTMTKLESWCEEVATSMYKADPKGRRFTGKSVLELPNGAGYLYLRIAYKKWLSYVKGLAEHVILVCHVKDKLIDKEGVEVSSKDLDLTGKIRNMTSADADAIGYLYRKDNKLMINFQANEELVCGSRCEHLRGQNMEFDWDKIYID